MRILLSGTDSSLLAAFQGALQGIREECSFYMVDSSNRPLESLVQSCDAAVLISCGEEDVSLQTIGKIRSLSADVPIVLVARDGSEQYASKAICQGATGYYPLMGDMAAVAARVSNDMGRSIAAYHLLMSLRKSESHFRRMFLNAPIAYQSLDIDGNIIDVNDAWLATLGYGKDDVVGRPFLAFVCDGYADVFKENFPKFKKNGCIHGIEFCMKHKDGSPLLVYFDGVIGHTESGAFKQTHCVMHDRSKYADAVERLSIFMSSAREGFLILGPGMQVVDCNDAVARIVGATREEVLGKYVSELFPNGYDKLFSKYEEVFKSGEPLFSCTTLRHPLVGEVMVDVKAFKIGTDVGIIINQLPYTLPDEGERGELSSFAHMLSHDIRGPLAVIQGYADLLTDECDSPYLDKIKEKSREITDYILQSVELADASSPLKSIATVDVGLFVQEIANDVLTDIPIAVRAPHKVSGDPKRLRQLFVHLFSNISSHAHATSVSVTSESDGDTTSVFIRDDGVGIPEEYLSKIYERGFSTKRSSKGLGLSIVKKTIEAHGGTVSVLPGEGGKGTMVVLTFPAGGS